MSTLIGFWRRLARPRRPEKAIRRTNLHLEPLEPREVPALLGNQLFPSDNAWNQPVSAAPVAANSASVLNNLVGLYGDGRLHPDFG